MTELEKGRIAVLGLGGGMRGIAARLGAAGVRGLEVAVADTDLRALQEAEAPALTRIALGQEWTNQEGCGGDAVLGERAASASVDALRSFVEGARLLIVLAGLGGGTGSGAAKVVARLAREAQVTTLFLATLPFAFEGSWRRHAAEKSLAPIRELCEAVLAVPNDLLFTTLPANTPAPEAFALADSLIAEAMAGLARAATAQGLVTADFADIRALLWGRQSTCAFGLGAGTGVSRWQDAVEAFVACPLVGGRDTLKAADAAVLTLVGGTDLSIGEIQTCLAAFEQHFPADVRLVVGAYVDDRMEGALQISGVICRYEDGDTPGSDPAPDAERGLSTPRPEPQAPRRVQGELPLQEQSLGMFAGAPSTPVDGRNLDIPTFQRRGIHLDVGD